MKSQRRVALFMQSKVFAQISFQRASLGLSLLHFNSNAHKKTAQCAIPCRKKEKIFPNHSFKAQHFSAYPPWFTYYCTGPTQFWKEIPSSCAEILAVILTVFLISDVHFAEVISQLKHCFSLCGSYWVCCKYLAIFFPASLPKFSGGEQG